MILQNNFVGLINWCDKNGLKINFNKCFSMSYYRGKERVNYDYMDIDNNMLKNISTFRDLGVTFNSSLGFEEHITEITNSAMKLLGFITRNTNHFRNIFALKNLFCSIVRSRLEYASPIWSPYYKTYIQRLERVQRKFLRYIAFKLHVPIAEISYDDLYITLHILPLEMRREQADFLFLCNLINGKVDDSRLLELVTFNVSSHRTRNPEILSIPTHRFSYLMYSGMSRILRTGNQNMTLDIFNSSRNEIKNHFFRKLGT